MGTRVAALRSAMRRVTRAAVLCNASNPRVAAVMSSSSSTHMSRQLRLSTCDIAKAALLSPPMLPLSMLEDGKRWTGAGGGGP